MNNIIRLFDTQKIVEQGEKFYRAIVGVGFPVFGNYRILRRRWRTKSEAEKYMIDFYSTWYRLHKEA